MISLLRHSNMVCVLRSVWSWSMQNVALYITVSHYVIKKTLSIVISMLRKKFFVEIQILVDLFHILGKI